MDQLCLQDRIHWGLNVAAQAIGVPTDAYRPAGPSEPLCPVNRFLRLHAVFCGVRGGFERANEYEHPLWSGIFDAAYTRVGDYLVQSTGTWFVAAQQPLLPVLCVRADRVVSFTRAAAPTASGVNTYGGVTAATSTPPSDELAGQCPSCLHSQAFRSRLCPETLVSRWTVLLPAHPDVILRFPIC